jgi:hypothetical protein
MTDPAAFAKLVPGFDFLQGLVKNAGAAFPNVGHWIAPTVDPDEIDKRIQELRTVQFWLEQNSRMINATIQALEVQRMTLTTLRTMNVSLGDLTESLKIRPPAPAPEEPAAPAPAEAPSEAAAKKSSKGAKAKGEAAGSSASGVVPDPMQWWGALTKQFTELATNAMKEGAAEAARNLAAATGKAKPDAAESPDAPKRAIVTNEAAVVMPAPAAGEAGDGRPPAPAKKSARKR